MRFSTEDPSIECTFYNRQNDHVLLCRDDNRPSHSYVMYFDNTSDCVKHKDDFCRSKDHCQKCPLYKAFSEEYA